MAEQQIDENSKSWYIRQLAELDIERSSFMSHWKELSENIQPRRGVFLLTDRNKGTKRNNKIINSRGSQALRTASAGLFAGTMSPTRPWFKLEPFDENLMEIGEVKQYFYDVEKTLRMILLESGFYNIAPISLGDALLFGTGAMEQVADFENVAQFRNHPVGSFYVAQNQKGVVDTFANIRERTVKQIVGEFGLDACSDAIQNNWRRGEYNQWYSVCQFIHPNKQYVEGGDASNQNMPFRSVWFELGGSAWQSTGQTSTGSAYADNKFLRKSGFKSFPIHVIRWAVNGEDIYGTDCPGMVALGDVKALQVMEKRKAQAVDKLVNPPLKGPPSLIDVPVNSLPGGLTIYDQDGTKEGLQALYVVDPHLQQMRQDMQDIEKRINEAFYVDLFLAISEMDGIQPRNQLELSQRNAERLLMLGPSLERVQYEFLTNVIELAFKQADEAGILPEVPQELNNQSVKINFISSLAHAQKAHEVGALERMVGFAGQLAQANGQVLDKINFDEAIDRYSQYIGVPPQVIVDTADAQKVRDERAAQAQQAQQMQAMQMQAQAAAQGSQAVKNVSEAQQAEPQ